MLTSSVPLQMNYAVFPVLILFYSISSLSVVYMTLWNSMNKDEKKILFSGMDQYNQALNQKVGLAYLE